MNKAIIIIFLLFSNLLVGQTYFNNDFSNDSSNQTLGSMVYPLQDRTGYFVVGLVSTNESLYIRFMRLDIMGDTIWTKMHGDYGIALAPNIGKIISVGDTNFIFAGQVRTDSITASPDSSLIILFNVDINGNVLWEKVFGENGVKNFAQDVQKTIDNGFIITGWTTGWGGALPKPFLIKVDSLGNKEWHQVYPGGQQTSLSVDLTSDNGYIIAGENLLQILL